MSTLSNLEKRKFERLLGMSSGYVLDFSNRTFAEFIVDCTGHNIFDSRYDYGSGSKANRLRTFWQVEENEVVAKLMADILSYGFPIGVRQSATDATLESECRLIVERLSKSSRVDISTVASQEQKEQSSSQVRLSHALRQLETEFYKLSAEVDRNKAGLALEKLLNKLFEAFELQPRQPFRVVGEQIDGSFLLDGQVYLLESKWEKNPLPEAVAGIPRQD